MKRFHVNVRARIHELRCAECRTSWGSWWWRVFTEKPYDPQEPDNEKRT